MRGNGCYLDDCKFLNTLTEKCRSSCDKVDYRNLKFPTLICDFHPAAVTLKEWQQLAKDAKREEVKQEGIQHPIVSDWVKSMRDSFRN